MEQGSLEVKESAERSEPLTKSNTNLNCLHGPLPFNTGASCSSLDSKPRISQGPFFLPPLLTLPWAQQSRTCQECAGNACCY